MTLEWQAILGEFAILVIIVIVLSWRLSNMRRRHAALTKEVTRMLVLHQDWLASFDGRLRALGSRTAGDQPVPTSAEMVDERWYR